MNEAIVVAELLARSELSEGSRLLEEVMAEAEANAADDELSSYWSPASSAGYWLVRRTMARHWRQGIALGPGDLTETEITELRRLARLRGWGSGWAAARECGLLSFDHLDRLAGLVGAKPYLGRGLRA